MLAGKRLVIVFLLILVLALPVFAGGFDGELMGQIPIDEHLGLEAKLQWRIKPFNKRLDLGAGACYYLFEMMQGPYASVLLQLSHAEARVDGYELQLFPELALGWMWTFGSKSAMQVGIGVETSVGWVLFAYESGTFEPWISRWFGGNL